MIYLVGFLLLCVVVSLICAVYLRINLLWKSLLAIWLPIALFQTGAYFTGGWDQFILIAIFVQFVFATLIWLLTWGSVETARKEERSSDK